MRIAVVVLGDLGRSPRMLYHAQALASHGVDVDLVGVAESALPGPIRDDPRIRIHAVGGPSRSRAGDDASRWRYLASAAWRGVALLARLTTLLLWRVPQPDAILVQNPPGVPVLLVAWIACRVRSARFLIDWHNLTHSMLSLRLGAAHPLVRIVRWYEGAIGRRADLHLFVSRAMQEELGTRWQLAGIVFRDRPAESFQPITAVERESVRGELRSRFELPSDRALAMAVSPTSWTADEDFDLLLEAATLCEALIREQESSGSRFPELLVLLTGRGPLRPYYERRMAARPPSRIHVRTIWLEPGDYPLVLAAADLGLCLHRSTSGVDLPMKVADMFGAGIPVCALNYGPCLSEIVQHGTNGLLFSTAAELAGQLHQVFRAFPADERQLASFSPGVSAAQSERWQAAWTREVWPVVSPLPRV